MVTDSMSFIKMYLSEASEIIKQIDLKKLQIILDSLLQIKKNNGRIFFLGVGGSAANASHAVNDFRKIAGIECYAPTDNISELTARINDDGWEHSFADWLQVSRLSHRDGVFVLSVGGGNLEKNVSPNLVKALQLAQKCEATIMGIVGRDGGYTAKVASACIVVPVVNSENITPHTEAFQAVLWHMLVSHPALKAHQTKWESTR